MPVCQLAIRRPVTTPARARTKATVIAPESSRAPSSVAVIGFSAMKTELRVGVDCLVP